MGGQFIQTRWRMSLLRLVTAQGQFSQQHAFAGHHLFVFWFGPLQYLPDFPPVPHPDNWIELFPALIVHKAPLAWLDFSSRDAASIQFIQIRQDGRSEEHT